MRWQFKKATCLFSMPPLAATRAVTNENLSDASDKFCAYVKDKKFKSFKLANLYRSVYLKTLKVIVNQGTFSLNFQLPNFCAQ